MAEVRITRTPEVWKAVFANEGRRNAMTWSMYDDLVAICEELRSLPPTEAPRVLVLAGDGDAFVAGTDISQFQEFASPEDGVAYERRVSEILRALLEVPIPVLGVIRGAAVGGGLAIAACCDVLIAADDALFGVPIARTLGNCLSPLALQLLASKLGAGRVSRMLYGAELIRADEAKESGFVAAAVAAGDLGAATDKYVGRMASFAPLTLRALKATNLAVWDRGGSVDADEMIRMCYGSRDFNEGVRAFLDGRRPSWSGT